ncbi:MAG: bifunctional 5,10-methylene-tetrahydrofolate dehydrogenase/5,10-methylene-tetrahydrofolate cyclohydrolase [Synergistaceae bacterium]|nr:bifunctional 5,10-methylene-tetrahydrofolate dehydrogenase/5,10-methylene-tetrahydrofolate cyclohydrolase [Synergistaceae bacterium]
MAEILKGAPVATTITDNLKARADALKERGIIPKLKLLRVGDKPEDLSYEKSIMKRCEKIGIIIDRILYPGGHNVDMNEVISRIKSHVREINGDNSVHGCMMFRPAEYRDYEQTASEYLNPEKDTDCMTTSSLAGVFTGSGNGFPPCTAQACIELLDYYGVELEGKNVAVVGRSLVIGRPVSMLLMNRNATVTMCHSRTRNLPEICRNSDIIIAAIGRAGFIDASFMSPGQVIVDVGINLDAEGRLCGDVNFTDAERIVKAVTPVPGGVGAVTTAVLAKHVIEAAERK